MNRSENSGRGSRTGKSTKCAMCCRGRSRSSGGMGAWAHDGEQRRSRWGKRSGGIARSRGRRSGRVSSIGIIMSGSASNMRSRWGDIMSSGRSRCHEQKMQGRGGHG